MTIQSQIFTSTWLQSSHLFQRFPGLQPARRPVPAPLGAREGLFSRPFCFIEGWSTVLTLPRWWVQFAHGSSLLKIFASKVLRSTSNESIHQMADCWGCRSGSAPDNLPCFSPLRARTETSWGRFHAERASWPAGLWNLIKKLLYHVKNEWVLREDEAVFFFPGKLRVFFCRDVSLYVCLLRFGLQLVRFIHEWDN